MNTWWYRMVGALGVAGGLLLPGMPGASAAPLAPPDVPQPVTGAVGNLLEPGSGLLGPLGVAPSTVVPDTGAAPGASPGPLGRPPAGQRPAPGDAGRRPDRETAGRPVAGTAPAAPAVPPVPAVPAVPVGGLGDLLSGGDLLGGGLLPADLWTTGRMPSVQQLPVVLADRMATQRPELFATGLPLLGGLGGLPVVGGGDLPGMMPPGGTPVDVDDVATVPAANQGTGLRPGMQPGGN